MKSQQGFTLIELVVVIVILGILAATALPKFVSLQGDAGDAAAKGVAGALSSASMMNYAKYQISAGATGVVAIPSSTGTCANVLSLLAGGAFPDSNYTWATNTAITCSNPAGAGGTNTTSCLVKHSSGNTAAGFPVTVVCTN